MFHIKFHALIFSQDSKKHLVLTIPTALLGLTYVFMSDANFNNELIVLSNYILKAIIFNQLFKSYIN